EFGVRPRGDEGRWRRLETRARWVPAVLRDGSGVVVRGRGEPGLSGFLFCVSDADDDPERRDQFSAQPHVCPCCGADRTWRLNPARRSTVRAFQTGLTKVTQLLARELYGVLPDDGARKLVAFTDSREDAAGLANGVERAHFWDLLREAAYDEM